MEYTAYLTLSCSEVHTYQRLQELFALLRSRLSMRLNSIEMALQEAVTNAIEHGCLEIGFEMKRMLLEYNRYDREVARRRGNPRFAERTVTVSCFLTDDTLTFSVADDGKGFCWKEYLPDDELRSPKVSGSGLTIITAVFDEVSFNEQGNVITMTKRLVNAEES